MWNRNPSKPALRMNTLAAAATVLTVALAGCNQAKELVAEAEVMYDGGSNGSHSDTATCDADGDIRGNGDVQDGSVTITVEDSDGTELFQRTFDGSFDLSKQPITGDSGTWSISAVRTSDDVLGDQFAGEYAFFLNC